MRHGAASPMDPLALAGPVSTARPQRRPPVTPRTPRRQARVPRADLDAVTDPLEWTRRAVEACLELWLRLGPRHARRLQRLYLCRVPHLDVLALGARRGVPLPNPVLRPLPEDPLPPLARAFNRLAEADRRVLLAWGAGAGRPEGADGTALDEHRASALQRLVEAAGKGQRPPPPDGDGRQPLVA